MMKLSKKKIAIVGGGFAGLGSIVILKVEGFDPVCFEKTDKAGGTWCYREKSTVGVPSIMPTTLLIHSKELGALSNFPPEKEYPNFMRHSEFYRYFLSFVDKSDALKHVHYNSEVIEVKRTSDYEETGRWIVTVKDTVTGKVTSDIYDAVIISVGHNNIPKEIIYEDQEIFKGKILHTHSLKGVQEYINKSVVIVGMGCSGLDAAVEVSSVAKQVYLSTRSGAHVLSRVGPRGYPSDYVLLRRYITCLLDLLPPNIVSWILETCVADQIFNSRLYAVKPQRHILSKDPIINDCIASKIISGSVIQKPDIIKFTEFGVVFDGENAVTEADVVIMATGYTSKFPFLEKDINIKENGRINLYKCIWHPNLSHSTLAFVAFFNPFGPGVPLGEMQCRWIAQVFAGKCQLPATSEMLKDIAKRHKTNVARYGSIANETIRVDYTQYLDEIAEQIKAKPHFLKMLFTDPELFFKLIFGPSVPYQYRLQGPHPWEGAREAIMKSEERVHWPFNKKEVTKVESIFVRFFKKFIIWLLPI